LCMMAPRLMEMRRVLKDTGSIYLHCDPTASHYLKLAMDAVFGPGNFINEIIWHYHTGGVGKRYYAKKHDIIFFYSKTNKYKFYPERVKIPRTEKALKRAQNPQGARITVENVEKMPEDVFEIQALNPMEKERTGYPTQKPEALLERIIKASSDEEDLVLDPFCGCGTTVAVAERLRRKWTGIDITYLAIDVIKKRLEKHHIKENEHFKVYGEPKDVYSAGKLAEQKPFQFEVWAVSQLNATPTTKTGDKGVDGVINFIDNTKKEKIGRGIISVKGGYSINPGMVRDLKGTIQSQNADFGILITLKEPTRGMIEEAVKEGSFNYCYQEGTTHKKIPKIQLLTVEDLFTDPIPVKLPPAVIEPYRKPDIKKDNGQQTLLI